ncbi:MAG: serine/threonine-protein kinase PknK, partial [Myxococcota bacterium]
LHPHNVIVDRADLPDAPLVVKVLDLAPGTPRSGGMAALPFLAPERLEGVAPSAASDLFSIGVTLHRLLTGALPYPDYPHMPEEGPDNREALGAWADLVSALMSRNPADRPRRASDVLTRLESIVGAPIPLVTPEIVRTTLQRGPLQSVGEWPESLNNRVDAILAGRAGVVAVEGALGSGRSRALRELKWALQGRGTRVLSGSGGAGDPSGALARRLLTQIPAEARSGLPPESLSAVNNLLQDRVLVTASDVEPAKARGMAVDNLARALLWLARRGPMAILVTDLDAADRLSAEVLHGVARYVAHRPSDAGALALVATGRKGQALDSLLESAGEAGMRVTPRPFDTAAVRALLSGAFAGPAPTHRLTRSLVAVSGGNPLVISEAVASALEQGLLRIGTDDVDLADDAPDPLPVPTSANDAILGRLAAVAELDRPLLALLAMVSTPVPASLAAPALGTDEATAGRRIEALRAAGVVRWQIDEGEARLAPATPALREAIARDGEPPKATLARLAILDASLLSLAGRVVRAEAVLALGGGDAGERGAELVARELLMRGKAAEALGLLQRLSAPDPELLGEAHATQGDDDAALEAWSSLPDAVAAERGGVLLVRRGRYPEALERLGGSEESLRPDTLAWLARAHMMQSDYPAALATCDRADAVADDALRPRLGYVRGLVQFYQGDYVAAGAAFEEALAAWKKLEDPIEQATVVNALGLVHFRQGELGPALDHFQTAIKLADSVGDRERTLLTLMNLAVIHQERAEYGPAESRYREALSMARVLGHRSGVMKVTQNLGNLFRYLGALGPARSAIEESLGIAEADANQYIACHNRTLLGEIAWLEDRVDDSIALLKQALTGFNEVGSVSEAADCARSLAAVALDRGDMASARSNAKAALATAQEKGLKRVEALARLTLADVERRSSGGDLDEALSHIEEAREKLGTPPRPDLHWQVLLGLHRVRRARGEGDAAATAGQQALKSLRELADKLPETRRGTFLGVRNRREAVHELTWLEGLTASRGSADGRGQLSRLLDVNQRLTEELDLSRLLEYIIDSAILLSGAERGFLLMLDGDDDELKIQVARNIDQENIRNKRYKVSYNIAERVIEAGEAVLTTDAMGDERYSEYLSINHLKLRSVLCLPMSRQGKVIGALYVDNRFQRNAFSEQDMAFMEAFANQAAIAVTNARLLDERERTAKKLATSQARVEDLNKKLQAQLEEKKAELAETEQMLRVQRRELERSHGYESIIGDSPPLRAVFHVLDRVCKSEVPVLVTGDSGTGKELVARALHYQGPRKDRAFVAINCSSIPETLIESELFGHVRGSFTGATSDKKGLFEVAHRGTLFLDEIGEMPFDMQAKLLRALQEGEIQKVGSPRTVTVDTRIIAATNRNLREMIAEKRFREDLYYRLAVVTIPLPTLRQRREDIPILVQHFITANKKQGLGRVNDIAPAALRLLMRYDWPGNVRELETVVKNASIFCEGEVLQPPDFSNFPNIVGSAESTTAHSAPTTTVVRPLSELEREAIIHALEINRGNKKRTAEQLGIDRRTLYNKLAAYGISVERRAHVLGRDS